MPAFVPNIGEATLLNYIRDVILGAPTGKAVFLRLYKNNYTPVPATVLGDFTECDFRGYVAGGVQLDAWTAAATDGNGKIIMADEKTFSYDSGEAGEDVNPVYGAFVVDEDDNVLGAERFSPPLFMGADGDEFSYQAKLKLTEKTEACA